MASLFAVLLETSYCGCDAYEYLICEKSSLDDDAGLMAEENAYSRIPLGVHWRMDCKAGIDLGYVIGRKVNKLPFK